MFYVPIYIRIRSRVFTGTRNIFFKNKLETMLSGKAIVLRSVSARYLIFVLTSEIALKH